MTFIQLFNYLYSKKQKKTNKKNSRGGSKRHILQLFPLYLCNFWNGHNKFKPSF